MKLSITDLIHRARAPTDLVHRARAPLGANSLLDNLYLSDFRTLSREELERAIRARVQTVFLGNGRILARVLGGPKMFLSADDHGFGCHVMFDGYWESWLTTFFARILTPGMTVIDVGANFGYYTALFAMGVGAGGRVIAIEPFPATASYLKDTVALNGYSSFTRVVEAAATAESGRELHLFIPKNEPKNASIVPDVRPDTIPVASCTIDELTADLDRVDLVKIDAEGAEIDVVAGMRETIARHRPSILLEYNAARYADPQAFLEGLLRTYHDVSSIDWDGTPRQITPEAILSTRFGEDWLLYFDGARD
jgi:FkbM family methyltransferase